MEDYIEKSNKPTADVLSQDFKRQGNIFMVLK